MTLDQLINAYKAVHNGVAPDATAQARLQYFAQLSNHQPADAAAMSYIVNSADNSTALAALSYQFFTGKAPTKAGLEYLVNSSANPSDLHDQYYSKFNLENRYINFAANLGVQGEGAAAFAAKYGTLSFADYVASIYQTIIGATYAQAAGVNVAAAIADIVARKDAILATAASAGMIGPNATAAQIDLALKAATAGYLLGEAIKADVGAYASAANNFAAALVTGDATYGTDLTATYAKPAGQLGGGGGQAVAPNFSFPTPVAPPVEQPNQPSTPTSQAFTLTTGADTFTGGSLADTFTGTLGTGATFGGADVLNGGGGIDTLSLTSDASNFTFAPANLTSIETLKVKATTQSLTLNLASAAFTDLVNDASTSTLIFAYAAPTSQLTISNTSTQTSFVTPTAGLAGASDVFTLKLDTVTGAAAVWVQTHNPNANEYETMNIVSNGGANSITLGTNTTQASLATINISGSANLDLRFAGGGDQTAIHATTIDAHALTGGLTVTGTATIANTIIGGSGADVITLGAQNANAVSGADVITTHGGADTIRFVGNVAAGTGASTDVSAFARITDFSVANDKIAFSAGDLDFSLRTAGGAITVTTGLARGTTAQGLTAASTMVVQSLAKDAAAAAPITDVSFIKLTTGVAFNTDIKTTFADAIGIGSILHLAANGNYLVSVYDTTHQQMIVAVVNVGGNADADDNLFANDFVDADVAVVGVLDMSSGDYSAFGAGNLGAF